MIGAIIGAATSIGSMIAGGIGSAKQRAERRRLQQQQLQENQNWYNKQYYANPTLRADASRLLTKMSDTLRERTKAAKGRQAVMGGTEDSLTATKSANNKVLSDTTSMIAADNDARKDRVQEQYMRNKNAIRAEQRADAIADAANTAETIKQAAATATHIADAVDSYNDTKTDTTIGGEQKSPESIASANKAEQNIKSEADNLKVMQKDTTDVVQPVKRRSVGDGVGIDSDLVKYFV